MPIQSKVKQFFANFAQYPNQLGSSMNAGGINYGTLRMQEALQRLQNVEEIKPNQ